MPVFSVRLQTPLYFVQRMLRLIAILVDQRDIYDRAKLQYALFDQLRLVVATTTQPNQKQDSD